MERRILLEPIPGPTQGAAFLLFMATRGRPSKQLDPSRMATQRPSAADIAWAAGIYEGEGCVQKGSGYLTAEITQKDPWLCERLRALFGGAVYSAKNNGNPNDINVWSIGGVRARGFLLTVFTYLSPRRRQQVRGALEVCH